MAEQLLVSLGGEKAQISAQSLKSDPATLADEAGAIGLFGDKRVLWIDPAGEEIVPAVQALLGAPACESSVIALAGPLRKTSGLLQLTENSGNALAHQSRELRDGDLERIVEEMARSEGLQLGPGVASRIASAAGGDRGIVAQEVAKLALFVDASPHSPARADVDLLEQIGAGSEGESGRLGDLALAGDAGALASDLAQEPPIEPISLVRAIQRRLAMLAPLRARVDAGSRSNDVVASAGKAVFFKEKAIVAAMLEAWDSPRLARLADRVGELERRLMRPDSPPDSQALVEELVAIARSARRR